MNGVLGLENYLSFLLSLYATPPFPFENKPSVSIIFYQLKNRESCKGCSNHETRLLISLCNFSLRKPHDVKRKRLR